MEHQTEHPNYFISLKDICRSLSLDVRTVNEFVSLSYEGLRRYAIPHLELSIMDRNKEGRYITNGVRYECSNEDVFCVSPLSVAALPYALLDLMRDPNIDTKYNERFACIFSITVADCFAYAPQFDMTNN